MALIVREAVVVGAAGKWLAKLAGVLTGSVDEKGKLGWADVGSEIKEVVLMELDEDDEKLGRDPPEEKVVAVVKVG